MPAQARLGGACHQPVLQHRLLRKGEEEGETAPGQMILSRIWPSANHFPCQALSFLIGKLKKVLASADVTCCFRFPSCSQSVSFFSGKVRRFPSSWSSSPSPPLSSPPHTLHKSPSSTHSFSETGLFCPPAWASPIGRGIHAAVTWGLALLRFPFFLPVAFSGRSPRRGGKWGLPTVCQHLWESP